MRIATAWILAVGLTACSGGDDGGPITCAVADRAGTYLITSTELDGTCGPLTSQLARLDADPAALGCERTVADVWSDEWCTLERSIACSEPGLGVGWYSVSTGISTQQDDSGALVTGTITIQVFDPYDAPVCASTYRMRAERQ